MNWLNKLERRFGRFAIPHIILYVIVGQVIATLMAMQHPEVVEQMLLDPAAIMRGEYWRLVTFVMIPDTSPMGLLFAIFWFYFLYMMGQGLEQEWGAFKLNVYLISGMVFQALVSLLALTLGGMEIVQAGMYWTLSIWLAFAYLYPDFTMYIMMILPIKMRWGAWLVGAYLLFQVFTGGLVSLVLISAALGNYLLFFGPDYVLHWRLRRQTSEVRASMKASLNRAMATAPVKRCKECGLDGMTGDIRLCSCERCGEEGTFWCMDHLAGHLKKS